MKSRLERSPEIKVNDEVRLGLAVLFVQQALISAYKNNCPLKPVRTGRHSLKWTPQLESLSRAFRQLFNNCRTDRNSQSWECYKRGSMEI